MAGVIDGQPVNSATFNNAFIPLTEKGQPDGVCPLDSNGKVPAEFLTVEALEYKGTWDASANLPLLQSPDPTASIGDLYYCNVAGTVDIGQGLDDYEIGDRVVYNGTIWEKWANGEIASLGEIGDVDLTGLANGQILQYNTVTSKWEPVNNINKLLVRSAGDFTAEFQQNNIIQAGQGALNITLPIPVAADAGKQIIVKLASDDYATDVLTLDSGVRLIDGEVGFTFYSGQQSVTLVNDGTNYLII